MSVANLAQETMVDTSRPSEEVTLHDDGTISDNVKSDQLDEAAPAKAAPEGAAETPEPAYIPNTKFKVHDQEKDFDEWAKPLVTKDTEGKFRELYEKAHGLDVVKPKLQEARQEVGQLKNYIQSREKAINEILSFRDSDLDRFFESVQLPPQKVAEWLLQKLQIQNLPPDQQQVYNEAQRLKREKYDLQKQLEEGSTRYVDSAVQARATELSQQLSRPELTPLIQQFNDRMGNPNAFAELVVRHGNAVWVSSEGKTDLSVEQAVNDCLKMIGLTPPATSPVAQPSGAAQPPAPQPKVITPSKPTVLPNVGNPASSAVSSKPKSIADLRKMAAQAAE